MKRKVLMMGAAAVVVATATTVTSVSLPSRAGAAPHTAKLLVRYSTTSPCTIYPNYPKAGVVGNAGRTWTIGADKTIVWRYNVNATWAVVSDPVRAQRKQFPWWGFTRSGCIGRSIQQTGYPAGQPVPSRILSGRSQQASGWRTVVFRVPPAPVTARHRRVTGNGTLRDPANFVIGNVFPGWHVDVTGRTRSNGHWVEVYVPNARRWGYLEAGNLR
jgi:hypothetical protein